MIYNLKNVYSINNLITPLNPSVTGVEVTYSISPALPAGLEINTSTGIISGTPTLAQEKTIYTVTVTNSGGSTTADLDILVYNNAISITLPPAVGSGTDNVSIPMNTTQTISPVNTTGVNVLAYINSQANFKVPESTSNWQSSNHSFKINNLDLYRNIITLTFSSNPQVISLKKGETREVDLDGDKINDILVSFTDIYVNRAEIKVVSLSKGANIVKPTPVVVTPIKPKTFVFAKDLKLNAISPDVKELQKYLNASGYLVAKTGVGSKGKETTKFGLATKFALIKFQKAKKINPANGIFGPATRKVINGK